MPYRDYAGFGEEYFEGHKFNGGHPAGYSNYLNDAGPADEYARQYLTEAKTHQINPYGGPVLIVGCAFGDTVNALLKMGVDAYGIDLSSWAVENTPHPISNRIFHGDITRRGDIRDIVDELGVGFRLCITESVLSCLTEAEARRACGNLRSYSGHVMHRVWATDGSAIRREYYNSKPLAEWKEICDSQNQDIWFPEQRFN